MTDLQAVARSDVGRQRDRNEDFAIETGVRGGAYLLAVADGMGGHAGGEIASATGLKSFADRIADGVAGGSEEAVARELLANAVETANEAVLDAGTGSADHEGMGTTLVGALVMGDEALVVNVGDSRAYLVHGNGDPGIDQITVDHSMVRDLVEADEITEQEAETHPKRHVLSQALGVRESVDAEFHTASLDGATLLLCSDGLTEEVSEDEIARIVAGNDDLAGAAEGLIDRANERGGSDNISVVLGRRA